MNQLTEEQSEQDKHEAITPREVGDNVISHGDLRVHLIPSETVRMQESAEKQAGQELATYQERYDSGAYNHLSRYHVLMNMGLKDVDLSYGEASLIIDCMNGTVLGANIRFLPAHVSDAIFYDNLAEKWSIDGEALLAKLRQAGPLVLCAIVDAAEKFWDSRDTDTYSGEMFEVGLKRVGLIR